MLSRSKIQSESNSQLYPVSALGWPRLCSVGQRYNLKAIHNINKRELHTFNVVLSRSKIQSESNSQQKIKNDEILSCCAQ